MTKRMDPKGQGGFTLLEIIMAMTILTLVLGSVFSAVQVGVDTYERGRQSMELYQSARIGMRKTMEELQFALSQASFWQPSDQIRALPPETLFAMFGGMMIQENDPGKITFIGGRDQVKFVRKIYQMNKNPRFDLQECIIAADAGNELLYLEVARSLLEVKRASWFFQELFQTSLNGVISYQNGQATRFRKVGGPDEPPLHQFIGNTGVIQERYVLAEGIRGVEFRYTDGEGWHDSWSSTDIITNYRISAQSPNFDPNRDMQFNEKGPPRLVEITLELSNGDYLSGSVELGTGNLRSQKGVMGVESAPPSVGEFRGARPNPNAQQPGANQPGADSPVTPPAFPTVRPQPETPSAGV